MTVFVLVLVPCACAGAGAPVCACVFMCVRVQVVGSLPAERTKFERSLQPAGEEMANQSLEFVERDWCVHSIGDGIIKGKSPSREG